MRCNAIILIIMHHYRVAISNNNNYYDPVSGITLLYIHNYFRNTVSIIVGPDLNDTITRSAQRYRIIRDYLANRHPSSPPPPSFPRPGAERRDEGAIVAAAYVTALIDTGGREARTFFFPSPR